MKGLFITRAAEADVLEIWIYLFEKSEQAADRVVNELTRQYALLCEFPMMGRARSEYGAGYRSFPVGDYVIFYRVRETLLEISRVVHGSRDLTTLFTPEDE